MSVVYAVGCNFRNAELEHEWNDWYNGPKMAQMLALPLFENVQRFEAADLDMKVKYLAVWLLKSADALSTPEYVSTWGFDRWAEEIYDWTRDLITPIAETTPPVPASVQTSLLHVAWFDRAADLRQAKEEAANVDDREWWWGENSGLDQSFGHMAISATPAGNGDPVERTFSQASRETIFRPISSPGRAGSGSA